MVTIAASPVPAHRLRYAGGCSDDAYRQQGSRRPSWGSRAVTLGIATMMTFLFAAPIAAEQPPPVVSAVAVSPTVAMQGAAVWVTANATGWQVGFVGRGQCR